MSGWKADHRLGGRSSRASKRATPVPGIEDVGSSDEYSDYVDEKDDNLKGKRSHICNRRCHTPDRLLYRCCGKILP